MNHGGPVAACCTFGINSFAFGPAKCFPRICRVYTHDVFIIALWVYGIICYLQKLFEFKRKSNKFDVYKCFDVYIFYSPVCIHMCI